MIEKNMEKRVGGLNDHKELNGSFFLCAFFAINTLSPLLFKMWR